MPATPKADQAYQAIERLITFGQLQPGTLLSEATLMQHTGLGRTPVREAVQRLARNRMLEIHPSRGIGVPPASVDDQLHLLETRRPLEVLAVRQGCLHADTDTLTAMSDLAEELRRGGFDLVPYVDTLHRTHHLIAHSARNPYLADALAPLHGLSRRFWVANLTNTQHDITQGAAHHIAILEAITARNTDRAMRASLALNDHLVTHALRTLPATRSPDSDTFLLKHTLPT